MSFEAPADTPERAPFLRAIEPENISALWAVMADIITPTPKSGCKPHLWRFAPIRDRLLEASPIISAKEAERRVMIMENPGMRGESKLTTSLYAGIQLVTPGEIAPAHRHSQSALRLVLDSKRVRTIVNGERTEMRNGGFVITPHWEWHDHKNTSDDPIFWLDALDLPIVQFFDASFAESHGDTVTPADLCLAGQAINTTRFDIGVEGHPTIARIVEATMAIPAIEKAHPKHQPDAA